MPFNSNRDFDHQSGPDRQGPRQYGRRDGNWNPQDVDAQAAPESGDTEQVVRWEENHTEADEQLDSASAETEETTDGVVETPVEEEPKSYTLEEYKAMRQSAKPAVITNNKNLRKANDGKDVFANMVAHRKVQEVHEDGEQVEEKENEPEAQQPIDIDFSFTDEFGGRRRGGRGFENRGFDRGRGGARGARPRGERGGQGRDELPGLAQTIIDNEAVIEQLRDKIYNETTGTVYDNIDIYVDCWRQFNENKFGKLLFSGVFQDLF
uniref:Hyaluronan/mRNA-binding protein domain-containing protein n=1 Tax=Trichobilharzia regenti TaxID=157069 RepID=A0AA85KDI4_TRIRE|nr:unnamed protein product [Trichobilharzia regenti]